MEEIRDSQILTLHNLSNEMTDPSFVYKMGNKKGSNIKCEVIHFFFAKRALNKNLNVNTYFM